MSKNFTPKQLTLDQVDAAVTTDMGLSRIRFKVFCSVRYTTNYFKPDTCVLVTVQNFRPKQLTLDQVDAAVTTNMSLYRTIQNTSNPIH